MKRISFCILVFVLLSSIFTFSIADSNDSYQDGYNAGYDEGYNDGKSSAKSRVPSVKLIQSNDIPEAIPGEIVEFDIKFKNDSKDSALNLHITPDFENNNVLVYERPLSYSTTVSLRSNKEGSTSFKIKISEDAKKGTYPLKLKFEYKNVLGELFTREENYYFRVINEKSKPILNVSNIKLSSNELKYGDRFSASFDVLNLGESEAEDVEIRLTGFADSGIMPVDSKDFTYIGKIDGKKTVNLSYDFAISEDIETKDNTIKIAISYKGYDDKEYSTEKSIYVTGIKLKEKKNDDKKDDEDYKYAKPKMIITAYNTSKNNIIAGDEFNFTFTFKNTSREKDIRNIKITVGSTDGSFIITNGSNTFFVESLGRTNSLSKKLSLRAKQDLLSNSYPIVIDFEYEDYDGSEYTSRENINIPVTEYSRLVINSAMVDEGYVGSTSSLYFEYANMGKATISNLVASAKGDFVPVQENNYIGNIQAGNADSFDIEVKPTKVGLNIGTLILTFEDSSGRQIVVTRDFEANAMEEISQPTDFGDIDNFDVTNDEEKGTTYKAWQIILAGLGSLVVTFFISKIITKKILLKRFEDEI